MTFSLQNGTPVTEGLVAVLHYRITTLLLMGCCILVTALDWIGNGNSITCVMEGDSDSWTIPPKVTSSIKLELLLKSTQGDQHLLLHHVHLHPAQGPRGGRGQGRGSSRCRGLRRKDGHIHCQGDQLLEPRKVFQKYLVRLTTNGFPLYCSSKLACSTLPTYYAKCGKEERWVDLV